MRKGISPLIAATLLIVMVVAISTIVMGWLYTFTRTSQESVSNRTDEALGCSGANIAIQDVYLTTGTAGTARVIVKNTGYVDDMTIASAQLYNKTGHNFTGENIPITNFDKGDIITISFFNISVPTCLNFSQVFVGTTCGDVFHRSRATPKGC